MRINDLLKFCFLLGRELKIFGNSLLKRDNAQIRSVNVTKEFFDMCLSRCVHIKVVVSGLSSESSNS